MYYIILLLVCIVCLVISMVHYIPPAQGVYGPAQLKFAIHTVRADDTALRLIREAGFSWVIQLLEWREVQPAPERRVWEYADWLVQGCEYYGLNLALRLDHPPTWAIQHSENEQMPIDLAAYTEFVHEIANRYRGRVQAYIVWNEPNLSVEWLGHTPNPVAYTELLKAAYQAIKMADAEAIVVSAGLAPTNELSRQAVDDRAYLRKMYDFGAGQYFDVLGAHPYGFAYPPSDPVGAHESLNFGRLSEIREIMVECGDEQKPVWATEVGWTVSSEPQSRAWQRVTPTQQAEFLVDAFQFAMEQWPWLHLMAVWNLGAKAEQAEIAGYRIVDDDGTPLPAYLALAEMDKPIQTFREPVRDAGNVVQVIAPDVVIHLGDSLTVNPGWSPLYCEFAPCRRWAGQFYVPAFSDLPQQASVLKLEIMQVEEHGNLVRINGRSLVPQSIPLRSRPDFVTSWTTTTMCIPEGVLQHGHNIIELKASPRLVPYQAGIRFESLQVRNIRIVSEG